METQFVRIESYGLVSHGKKSSIRQVVNEGIRMPSACLHVPSPMMPNILYGKHVEDTARHLRRLAKNWQETTGKKLLDHAQLMLGCVASYPRPVADLVEDPIEYQSYLRWKSLSIAWAKAEFGDQFHACIEHLDERLPHLHLWSVAKEIGGRLRLGPIHPGQWAERGKAPKERIPAYKKAMRAFQDRYWHAVGRVMGWLRLSVDPQPRLSHKQWKARKRKEEQQKEIENAKKTQGHGSVHLDLQGPAGPAFGMRPAERVRHLRPR